MRKWSKKFRVSIFCVFSSLPYTNLTIMIDDCIKTAKNISKRHEILSLDVSRARSRRFFRRWRLRDEQKISFDAMTANNCDIKCLTRPTKCSRFTRCFNSSEKKREKREQQQDLWLLCWSTRFLTHLGNNKKCIESWWWRNAQFRLISSLRKFTISCMNISTDHQKLITKM